MQSFVRRKNIEHFTKQLAGGLLDEAQRLYAEKMLAGELANERACALATAHRADAVPSPVEEGTAAPR